MNRWIDVGYIAEGMLIGRMDGWMMAGWTCRQQTDGWKNGWLDGELY